MLRNVSQLVPSNSGARHTKKLKNRLKGISISRNVSLIFNKKRLIYIPNPGGQLRPKYPLWKKNQELMRLSNRKNYPKPTSNDSQGSLVLTLAFAPCVKPVAW